MTGFRQREPVRVVQQVGMVHTRVLKRQVRIGGEKGCMGRKFIFEAGQPATKQLMHETSALHSTRLSEPATRQQTDGTSGIHLYDMQITFLRSGSSRGIPVARHRAHQYTDRRRTEICHPATCGKDNPVSGQTLGEVWKFEVFYLYLVLFNIRLIMEKKPEARAVTSVYFL